MKACIGCQLHWCQLQDSIDLFDALEHQIETAPFATRRSIRAESVGHPDRYMTARAIIRRRERRHSLNHGVGAALV